MLDNTLELAENKLLLLYIVQKINLPISNMQLTDIVLKNNFMNYFNLQQYLSELVSNDFLEYIEDVFQDGKTHKLLILTEKGTKTLSLFKNRISEDKIDHIHCYLNKNIDSIKKEMTISADYTIENDNNFIVNLKASENNYTLIDIKIGVPSNNQARELCKKWNNNSSKLYKEIMQILVEEDD